VPSPTRFDRHEVVVPYRVLPGGEVAGSLGCLPPVRSWRLRRSTLPVFLPLPAPKDATPWTILSWGLTPLHGVARSLRPRSLDRRHLSWGFLARTTLQEKRVHVPNRLPGQGSLVVPGGSSAVSTPPTTVPLAGFLNLSTACSSLHRPAIFRQVASCGFALQGFVPSTKLRRLLATAVPS